MKIIRTNARVESGGGTVHTDILYADLLALINNNELVLNSSYRITNYTTTTTQTDTQSARHDFDIIVTALSTNKLSEVASCVRKADDTYFTNAKLEAWEIKYCINNDTTRFAWADAVNGKGVIYYMKDEWNNECPYDFKNIQFKKADVFLYTFGGTTDGSLTGGCHHNTIRDFESFSTLRLNFNTFGMFCTNNKFGNGCYNNTFGNICSSNTLGDSCYGNTLGSGYGNTFGDNCNSNTFGDNCMNNTFGNECVTNAFGDNCKYNTFGNDCENNTFGNKCDTNTFGTYCWHNTFGYDCENNTFADYCWHNTFGTSCNSNTFGNSCSSNNFYTGTTGTAKKDYIRYIVLEDGCTNNNFYSSIPTGSSSYLQRIRIKGLQNNTVTNTQITLSEVNTNYEWLVCYTSSGVPKQYCPND